MAINAARGAGAERYAHEEFVAAEQALARGRTAADQRDYRLALSSALDSREQALSAARTAAEGKAKARGEASKVLTDAAALVGEAREKAKGGKSHASGTALAALRRAAADTDVIVQKARTAFNAGDYGQVLEVVPPSTAKLHAALMDLAAPAPPATRRRR